MFESLGNRFSNAFASLRSRGKLSNSDVANVCQEIRQALLDADVALSVVEDFVSKIEVEAKAALVDLQAGANQAQVIFEIVNQALVELLGSQARRVRLAKVAPTVIMLAGLQGAGKTTLAGKLAKLLNESNIALRLDSQCPPKGLIQYLLNMDDARKEVLDALCRQAISDVDLGWSRSDNPTNPMYQFRQALSRAF
jgi:signal recognition particle GTPase